MSRDLEYRQLICCRKWLTLRRRKLTAQPLCEICAAAGKVTPATEVHHVRPVESAPTFADRERLAYDWDNLQSLCHACHKAAHKALYKATPEDKRNAAHNLLADFIKHNT